MGNLSTFPALDVRPPATPPNALAEFGQVAAIQSHLQQQEIQRQEIQKNQQALTDNQAVTKAMQDWDPSSGDYNALTQSALKYGASANAATALQQHGLQVTQLAATLDETKRKAFAEKRKALADDLQPLTDPKIVPDDQLQSEALNHITRQVQAGNLSMPEAQPLIAGIQQTNDPATLRNLIMQKAKTDLGMAGIMAQQKTAAETASDNAKAANETAQAGLNQIKLNLAKNATPGSFDASIDKIYNPADPSAAAQNQMFKGLINDSLSRGDVDSAKKYVDQAVQNQQQTFEKLNPVIRAAEIHDATAKKAAEQVIQDGDPVAAAKLLHDGVVAPSQIISARKPEFAQKAFTAAAAYGDGWNAQKAEGDFNVAKSPANVAFFGSAKSLTDKGGTLDQLADAAKDIPENQIPVFNSVADVWKAATGSGPVAKYASILIGVTDDYSKVMGGGQGSDASRNQAIGLVPLKASPEQRAAAIEGIRGAVGSQVNSRIGGNPVLRQMYGTQVQSSSGRGGTSGKSVSLSAAKQLPAMAGKTDEEITALIKAQGHTVTP